MLIETLVAALQVRPDKKSLSGVDRVLDGVKSKLKGIATVLAPAALGAGLGALTKRVAEDAERAELAAQSLGITAESYQELVATFGRFGADADDVSDTLATLADKSQDAQGGVKSMVDDFKLIGISARDLKGLSPEQTFELFTSKLGETKDVSKATTAAVRILGDDLGRKVLPLLTQGEQGLANFRKEARDLGVIISEEDTKRASVFMTTIRRLGMLVRGLRNTLGSELIEASLPLLKELMAAGKELMPALIQDTKDAQPLLRDFFLILRDGVREVRDAVRALGGLSNAMKLLTIGVVAATLAYAALKGMAIGAAISSLAAWASAAAPFVALAAVIFGVILMVEDFYGWMTGERSSLSEDLFGPFDADTWADVKTGLLGVGAALILILALINAPLALIMAFIAALVLLVTHWDLVIDAVANFFLAVARGAKKEYAALIDKTSDVFLEIYEIIKKWFGSAIDWVEDAWDEMIDGLADRLRVITDPLVSVQGRFESGMNTVRGFLPGGAGGPAMDMERRALASSRPPADVRVEQVNVDARGMSKDAAQAAVRGGIDDSVLREADRTFQGRAE